MRKAKLMHLTGPELEYARRAQTQTRELAARAAALCDPQQTMSPNQIHTTVATLHRALSHALQMQAASGGVKPPIHSRD